MPLQQPRIEYYAFRHLPHPQFEGVNIIYTLFDTLCRIPETVTEPSVARQKLAFFMHDIQQIPQGTCQHPEVKALAELVQKYPFDLSPFNDIATAIEIDIDKIQFFDEQDLNRYCRLKRGALMILCGEFLKQAALTHEEKQMLEDLGVFIERVIRARVGTGRAQICAPTKGTTFFVLYRLYSALLKEIECHPNETITLNPLYALWISLRSRICY